MAGCTDKDPTLWEVVGCIIGIFLLGLVGALFLGLALYAIYIEAAWWLITVYFGIFALCFFFVIIFLLWLKGYLDKMNRYNKLLDRLERLVDRVEDSPLKKLFPKKDEKNSQTPPAVPVA